MRPQERTLKDKVGVALYHEVRARIAAVAAALLPNEQHVICDALALSTMIRTAGALRSPPSPLAALRSRAAPIPPWERTPSNGDGTGDVRERYGLRGGTIQPAAQAPVAAHYVRRRR